jgi:replicative DNA helicase
MSSSMSPVLPTSQLESKLKKTPCSREAERSVLGSIMMDNRSWDHVVDRIGENDFFVAEHRIIFKALSALSQKGQPFDFTTLTSALSDSDLDEIGGQAFIYEIVNNTPTAANVASYATIVREKAILRKLIEAGTDIITNAYSYDGLDVKEVLDKAESAVFKIGEEQSRGDGPRPIKQILPLVTDRIDLLSQTDDAITGLSTGFNDFDNMTSGLQPGDLVIIAGRPSMGKTSFSMNLAEHAAITADKPVLVFSLEMPAEQLTLRLFSSLGRIDQHKIRTGNLSDDDWPRISSAVSMLSQSKLYIDDTPSLTPQEMRARARRVARENDGLSLIVVDYLQLMTIAGSKENRTNEVSEISRSLKALAKELSVPLIALSQLNRGLEQRTDKRPVMSDLRESGSIEQDADVIAFIYRDEVYNEDSPDKGVAEIIIRKQRNGPIGDFRLTFLGQFTRFENYTSQFIDSGSFQGV